MEKRSYEHPHYGRQIEQHLALRKIRLRAELPARRRALGTVAAGYADGETFSDADMKQYRAGRAALLAEVPKAIGGAVLVLEA
jgi:hypothetical protein